MNDRMYNQELEQILNDMGGLYNIHDIFERIADGRMQSFVTNNTWMITEIHDYPRRKVLDVAIIVGNLSDFDDLYNKLVKFAHDINASLIRGLGRRGWKRSLTDRGWQEAFVTYHKDL